MIIEREACMKLLLSFPVLGYSGASKMMAWVANQMEKKGHDVHIVAFFSDKKGQVLHKNVQFHSLNVRQGGNWLARNTVRMIETIRSFHKLIKKINPDIVVSFNNSVNYLYMPFGAMFTKCKLINSERSDPYFCSAWDTCLRSFLTKFGHGSVFQTDNAREFYKKYKKIYNNSTVIPNPVVVNKETLELQQSIPLYKDRDKRIVTVGRLSINQKRQDVLLEAFKMFYETHPDYKLVIYGDGGDRGKIQQMIDDMGMSDSVTLAGRTDNVYKDIFYASALVLTSDYEGIPNALIEALSVGVPVVSTDCSPGGAALLIKNGENGFLVPRGDTYALSEKLSMIVDNSDISDRFSNNGPNISSKFSEGVISDKWESYLKSIIRKSDKSE